MNRLTSFAAMSEPRPRPKKCSIRGLASPASVQVRRETVITRSKMPTAARAYDEGAISRPDGTALTNVMSLAIRPHLIALTIAATICKYYLPFVDYHRWQTSARAGAARSRNNPGERGRLANVRGITPE